VKTPPAEDKRKIYYIDYEGCPLECSKEEYEKEMARIAYQTSYPQGGAK
jgi:hypothetical protein